MILEARWVISMDITLLLIEALKLIFPAYCANAVPVLAGGGTPIDFGRTFIDERPIFGKNKTYRGLFFGVAVGTGVGVLETIIFGYPILFGFLLSLGTLTGDLVGAFAKRRLGIAPGEMLPVVDQVDFIVGALLFLLPLHLEVLSWELALVVMLTTPPVHLLTNFAAYKLGLKRNPW